MSMFANPPPPMPSSDTAAVGMWKIPAALSPVEQVRLRTQAFHRAELIYALMHPTRWFEPLDTWGTIH
jgi:hypothetical protein